ncbi:carbonic anhydrase 2-like isoform X2 [Chelonus insularis]|uniref:carbonic anhydrase 2-like isoform X2 n=1 Tax=Chelonus insularis TaxID=460826 RepID=UPI00158EBE4A|nr:carbonic anhydrase 2-like isoform X2 [Chelonus insularis]
MILLINFCVFVLLHPFLTAAGLYFVIVGTIGESDSETHDDDGFNYHDLEMWKEKYPECGGNRQSPIDLNSRYFQSKVENIPLKFHGYERVPAKMQLTNSGHSLALKATWSTTDEIPYFSGGPFGNDDYVFEQLHFHWGANDEVGSEHTVNLKSFPLEMHMVHYNRKYEAIKNATEHEDGLSVIGIFFDIHLTGARGLENILKEIRTVIKPKSRVAIQPFPLTDFEGVTTTSKFASYLGSLTTPPCHEIVTWLFPITMLDVTKAQMETLRLMQLEHGDDHNHRTVQPINDRAISIFKIE